MMMQREPMIAIASSSNDNHGEKEEKSVETQVSKTDVDDSFNRYVQEVDDDDDVDAILQNAFFSRSDSGSDSSSESDDDDQQDKETKRNEKKDESSDDDFEIIKQNTIEKVEHCTVCNGEIRKSHNANFVSLECEHTFHLECFQTSCQSFRGSLCTECYKDRRFDKLVIILNKLKQHNHFLNEEQYLLTQQMPIANLCDMDSPLSVTAYISELPNKMIGLKNWKETNAIGGAHQALKQNSWFLPDINDDFIAQRSLNERVYERSNVQKIRQMITEQKEVDDLLKNGIGAYELLTASDIRIDDMLNNGYQLQDLYDLGFNNFDTLREFGIQPESFFFKCSSDMDTFISLDSQTLATHFMQDFRTIIEFFATQYKKINEPTESAFREAVKSFCEIGYNIQDLQNLGFNGVENFFIFGSNSFTGDTYVSLCNNVFGLENTDFNVIQQTILKLNKEIIRKIKFSRKHIEMLGWDVHDYESFFGRAPDALETIVLKQKFARRKIQKQKERKVKAQTPRKSKTEREKKEKARLMSKRRVRRPRDVKSEPKPNDSLKKVLKSRKDPSERTVLRMTSPKTVERKIKTPPRISEKPVIEPSDAKDDQLKKYEDLNSSLGQFY